MHEQRERDLPRQESALQIGQDLVNKQIPTNHNYDDDNDDDTNESIELADRFGRQLRLSRHSRLMMTASSRTSVSSLGIHGSAWSLNERTGRMSRLAHVEVKRRFERCARKIRRRHKDGGQPRLSIKVEEQLIPTKFQAREMFQSAGRRVIVLCRVGHVLRHISRGITAVANHILNAHLGIADPLAFDVEDFRTSGKMRMPSLIRVLLSKEPEERTANDIRLIAQCMRKMHSFHKYTREMQLLFSRIMRYIRCCRRRVVLRKGQIGYNLYFIFSGSVSVVMNEDEDELLLLKDRKVLKLTEGACFGEIALLQNTVRAATIVCSEESEFVVVEKTDFIKAGLHNKLKEEFDIRYNFFRDHALLGDLSEEAVRSLSSVSRTDDAVNGRVLVNDSRENELVWFVIEGSCEVMRLITLNQCPSYREQTGIGAGWSRGRAGGGGESGVGRSLTLTPTNAHKTAAGVKQRRQRHTRSQSAPLSKPRHLPRPDVKKSEKPGDELININVSRPKSCDINQHRPFRVCWQDDDSLNKSQTKRSDNETRQKGKKLTRKQAPISQTKEENGRIYVSVKTLRDGKAYGFEQLREDHHSYVTSLISRGSVVIHIPLITLHELAGDEVMAQIRGQLKDNPSDDVICQQFLRETRWEQYKRQVVQQTVKNIRNKVTFENSLRNSSVQF